MRELSTQTVWKYGYGKIMVCDGGYSYFKSHGQQKSQSLDKTGLAIEVNCLVTYNWLLVDLVCSTNNI